jgi:hypothetical protein
MLVFRTLPDAVQAGFSLYDHTPTGYIVRMKTPAGWAMALVDLTLQTSHA